MVFWKKDSYLFGGKIENKLGEKFVASRKLHMICLAF
uniref:Uncharacterized protein n=1 Tax=Arundo donax TaxID=35708 RepID=A0A0A9GKV2_ARUDO